MQTIALVGAAGNMGTRISQRLKTHAEYRVILVENPKFVSKLTERGDTPVAVEVAIPQADIVLMAVNDAFIAGVAETVVPMMNPGAMLVCLDPAAVRAGRIPCRADVALFVTHPCHPPVFGDETDPEARADYFGWGKAKQSIVSALERGLESDYVRGELLARALFEPILRSHRVSVEQMAVLEPAMSETVAATCIAVIREAMDEAIKRGVPEQAARDFMMGHIAVPIAICFNYTKWNFSAGAQEAIARGKESIFRSDWKRVFEPDAVLESVRHITTQRP